MIYLRGGGGLGGAVCRHVPVNSMWKPGQCREEAPQPLQGALQALVTPFQGRLVAWELFQLGNLGPES